jgi:hypothetical protein
MKCTFLGTVAPLLRWCLHHLRQTAEQLRRRLTLHFYLSVPACGEVPHTIPRISLAYARIGNLHRFTTRICLLLLESLRRNVVALISPFSFILLVSSSLPYLRSAVSLRPDPNVRCEKERLWINGNDRMRCRISRCSVAAHAIPPFNGMTLPHLPLAETPKIESQPA